MLFKRSIALLFLAIFLLADCGQVVSLHTCVKSKHASYSIMPSPKECCKADADTDDHCNIKRTCCSVTSKYIKQSTAAQILVQQWPVQEQANTFIVSNVFILPQIYTVQPFLSYPGFDDHVQHCTDLSFIQVFRC